MNEFNEENIGKLLRLKRHEQPPPGYFDNFLSEFHRRQRVELLRQPLWRIALQRAHDFMFQLNVPALTSYPAAAMAVVLFAAVLSLKVYQTPAHSNLGIVAQNQEQVSVSDNGDDTWSLSRPVALRDLGAAPLRTANDNLPRRYAATPRYVLDILQ